MLTLIDLGFEFWRNYYGSGGSATSAYEQTIERVEWYFKDCPRTVLCCEGGGSRRKAIYPEYKANRKPHPEDAIDSLVAIMQQVSSWGCPVVAAEGYEADDIVATITRQAWLEEVRILSNDKDLYQLIAPNVRIVARRGLIGEPECVAKFGVRPSQMRDWIALVGDASDNVPGCPRCGPGRARDLLQAFGSLEAVKSAAPDELAKVRGVGDKTIASIQAWDPSLAVSLVTLRDDAPVDLATLWGTVAQVEQRGPDPLPFQ